MTAGGNGRQRLLRWAGAGVHMFTALGIVCALLAMLAVLDGAYERAFAWLFVALFVDAVDGSMARAVDIEQNLPRFSGERLDLVIDYVTYVFVPVLALLHARLLEGTLGHAVAMLILLSSLYHFADNDSKSADNCFVGFPAVWNIVAFCLFAWGVSSTIAAAVSVVLAGLAFVPMHWLHPMRVRRLLVLNVGVTVAGLAAGMWVLWVGFPAGPVTGGVLLAAALYYVGLALLWRRWSSRSPA